MQIDDGGSDSASRSIMEGMIEFARTAAEGGFEITEEGGSHLLQAIDNFQDWISDHSHTIGLLEQERKLGTSNGAKVIGPFTQRVAGDDQGFITQLKALGDSLVKAREGIEIAIKNFRATEEATRANLKNISA